MSIASGIATLTEWLGEGGKPVDQDTSNARAETCARCRHNKPLDWKSLFKEGTATVILAYRRLRRGHKIETKHDSKMGECDLCGCILTLKVHVPLNHILEHTEEADYRDLPAWCWIRIEDFRKRQGSKQ